jgi:hypothetical protein
MPIQNVYLNWGTFINEADQTLPRGGETFMNVGLRSGGYKSRVLMKFNNDGFSGQMLSATLNFYCSDVGGNPQFNVFKVNRASSVNATWQSSGLSTWNNNGCEGVNEDRSGVTMITAYRLNSTGWNTVTITSLSELLGVINGLDTILLREVDGDNRTWARIEKSPAPYLAVEYKTSIVGGVQIF